MRMPLCAVCGKRFIEFDEEDVPQCPACLAELMTVPGEILNHPDLLEFREMDDEQAIVILAERFIKTGGFSDSAMMRKACRPSVVQSLEDIRLCDYAVQNDGAAGVFWNTVSQSGEHHGHEFPCVKFGKGKGQFSRRHVGYNCPLCGKNPKAKAP